MKNKHLKSFEGFTNDEHFYGDDYTSTFTKYSDGRKQKKDLEKNIHSYYYECRTYLMNKETNNVISLIDAHPEIINVELAGDNILNLSSSYQNYDVCKYLIDKGADINLKGHANFSPLSSIVYEKRLNEEGFKVFELLLEQPNIDINSISRDGSTPLILAVENLKRKDHILSGENHNVDMRLKIIDELLQKGANLYAKDYNFKPEPNDDGLNVFDIVNKNDHFYSNKYNKQILSILNKYKKN